MKQTNLISAIMVIILAFGLYLIIPDRPTNTSRQGVSQSQISEISYQGEDGKTALEILKATRQVETQKFDFGELVTAIDGVRPNQNEFWAFYVNNQPAPVGADQFQTKSTDSISWRIERIQ